MKCHSKQLRAMSAKLQSFKANGIFEPKITTVTGDYNIIRNVVSVSLRKSWSFGD